MKQIKNNNLKSIKTKNLRIKEGKFLMAYSATNLTNLENQECI